MCLFSVLFSKALKNEFSIKLAEAHKQFFLRHAKQRWIAERNLSFYSLEHRVRKKRGKKYRHEQGSLCSRLKHFASHQTYLNIVTEVINLEIEHSNDTYIEFLWI